MLNVLAILLNIIILLSGLALYGNYTTGLPTEIGSGMVASGLAALILVLYQIASGAVENRDQQFLDVVTQMGLRAFYMRRPNFATTAEPPTYRGAQRIQILELTGNTVFQSLQPGEWAGWAPDSNIQVLLQDPLHPPGPWTFTNHRDYEESNTIGQDLNQIRAFIKKFGVREQFGSKGQYELRLTRAMPTISYFRIDDVI